MPAIRATIPLATFAMMLLCGGSALAQGAVVPNLPPPPSRAAPADDGLTQSAPRDRPASPAVPNAQTGPGSPGTTGTGAAGTGPTGTMAAPGR